MKYLILLVISLFVASPCLGQAGPNVDALKLLTKGDLRGAIAVLDADVKDGRDLAENLKLRSDLKRMTGDLQGAFDDVSRALTVKPTGEMYRSRAELGSHLRRDPASILLDFDSAIAAGMKHERVYTSRGMTKKQSSDVRGAIEDFNAAVGLNPDFAQAYVALANAHRMNKENRKAIAVLEGYIRRYEESMQKVDPVKGTSTVVSSVELPARSSKGVVGLETTTITGGQRMDRPPSPEEMAQMSERMARSTNTSLAYANLANFYEEIELYENALASAEKAMAIDATNFVPYAARAIAKIGVKDYDGALVDIDQAIKKMPNAPIFYRTRGLAYLMLNRTREAELDFATFLERFPTGKDELERRKALAFKIRDGR